MSVRWRKGPDHHWMTPLAGTKPHWSRPPAANGPERNSPGWVMTVFSAFLFPPFWCPRTPHLHPAATSPCFLPVPLQPALAAPPPTRPSLVIYTNECVLLKLRPQKMEVPAGTLRGARHASPPRWRLERWNDSPV